MSFAHWLVVLSALISIAGSFAYIRDTLSGKSKPNRVSWLMWAIAPFIGTAAALSAGADIWPTFRIFLGGLLPLLVFLSSFLNPKSHWKLTGFDLFCGVFSLLAFAVWGIADSPQAAILFAALGDFTASLPTIRKAWKHPETETKVTYLASFLSVVLILPSIPVWNIQNAAFQLYLLVTNAVLVFVVYFPHLSRK